jgi:hypothetical protein
MGCEGSALPLAARVLSRWVSYNIECRYGLYGIESASHGEYRTSHSIEYMYCLYGIDFYRPPLTVSIVHHTV